MSDHLPDAIDKTKEAATRATHVVADKAPDIAGTLTNAAIDFVDATTHAAQHGAARAADAVSDHLPDAIDRPKRLPLEQPMSSPTRRPTSPAP